MINNLNVSTFISKIDKAGYIGSIEAAKDLERAVLCSASLLQYIPPLRGEMLSTITLNGGTCLDRDCRDPNCKGNYLDISEAGCATIHIRHHKGNKCSGSSTGFSYSFTHIDAVKVLENWAKWGHAALQLSIGKSHVELITVNGGYSIPFKESARIWRGVIGKPDSNLTPTYLRRLYVSLSALEKAMTDSELRILAESMGSSIRMVTERYNRVRASLTWRVGKAGSSQAMELAAALG
jgi:hypothetical protein